jgi:hypothetical protein
MTVPASGLYENVPPESAVPAAFFTTALSCVELRAVPDVMPAGDDHVQVGVCLLTVRVPVHVAVERFLSVGTIVASTV